MLTEADVHKTAAGDSAHKYLYLAEIGVFSLGSISEAFQRTVKSKSLLHPNQEFGCAYLLRSLQEALNAKRGACCDTQ